MYVCDLKLVTQMYKLQLKILIYTNRILKYYKNNVQNVKHNKHTCVHMCNGWSFMGVPNSPSSNVTKVQYPSVEDTTRNLPSADL